MSKCERHRVCKCEIGECDPVTNDVGPVFQVFVDGFQDVPLFCSEYFAQLENAIVRKTSNILSDGRVLLQNKDQTFLDTVTRF